MSCKRIDRLYRSGNQWVKENITKETEFKKKQIETLEMKSSINEIKYKI